MEIIKFIIVILLSLNIIGNIYIVGKERSPKSHGEAILDCIFISLSIYFIIN